RQQHERRRRLLDDLLQHHREAVRRVRCERRMIGMQYFGDTAGGKFPGHGGGICAGDGDLDRQAAGHRLGGGHGFPRRPIQRAVAMLRDDENHRTLASSRSRFTRSRAASAGEPVIICVRLLRVGSDSDTISWLPCSPAGIGTLRTSFFFAAMIPLSVAYRSWLIPLWIVRSAGSGMTIHWNQPPSSSRLTRTRPSSTWTSMMIVEWGIPRRSARTTPVCAWP